MSSQYITIEISNIPNLFPSGFIDKRYTLNRPIKNGYYDVTIETEQTFATIADTFNLPRKVQLQVYDKYMMKLPLKENDGLELLKYGDLITIKFQTGLIYKAKILSISTSFVEGSKDRFLEVEFYDINPINYRDLAQPIVNFLRSDTLLAQGFETTQLYELDMQTFVGNAIFKYYTMLVPTYTNIEIVNKKDEVNGIAYSTRVINTEAVMLRMYMNEADTMFFQRIFNICLNTGGSYGYTKLNRPSLSALTAIETLTADIRKIDVGIDLYEVNLTLKYLNHEYNNYV